MKNLEKRLYPALLAAARTAFARVRQEHPEERFYTFGLYTDGSLSYLCPTSNSEEALLKSSHGYAKTPLRWNPCDWKYHLYAEDVFEDVAEILNDGFDLYNDRTTERQIIRRYNAIIGVCEQVLRELDQEGLFGSEIERQSVLVGIFSGDESDEHKVEQAKRLNTSSLVARYEFELTYCDEWPPEADLPAEIPEDYL